ncbi:arylesterase [Notoacmeibacter ruber]|uniref:Arylesterase n=1 Tax=Notoacmeibacter ruber TaxID=2670375 RepID=A0A3L7JEA4_9HYPH|nr:arylesterase [Notoacmeibacter ruber]RLQ89108.1 arylesterase [Notoacmeibacter ruber]
MAFKHWSNGGTSVFSLLALVVGLTIGTPASADPVKIVAFGDSLMAGYQLGPDEGFAPRLEAALREKGYEAEVANGAVSGDTTSGGKARLDWTVPDDTDLVLVELGANDMLRGLPPENAKANLDAILARLTEREIAAILFGMRAAPQLGAGYVEKFESIYPTLAEEYEIPLVPFFLEGVAANRDRLLDDGMHPNPAGVSTMVENVLPVVTEAIDTIDGRSD